TAGSGVARLDALARRVPGDGPTPSLDEATVARFTAEMDDDFGTPGAVATIFDAVSAANQALDAGDTAHARQLAATVVELAGALGFTVEAATGGDAALDARVTERDAARAAGDFALADRIRDELAAQGVVLEDTPNG